MATNTKRRVCALCGIFFVLVIPPGIEETDRDKLCPNCLTLLHPPSTPDEAPARSAPASALSRYVTSAWR